VHDRSSVSEQRVEIRSIELRHGRTPATIIGDWPTVVLAAIGLTVSVVADRRSRRLVAPA
jgi:apolipoprotein N-acyltransferase